MKMLRKCTDHLRNRSGQALVEFTFVAIILLLMIFGLIDFCRAISVRQVITSLSREGSNLASRNTSLSNAVDAVIAAANPLNITTSGRVIITSVKNRQRVHHHRPTVEGRDSRRQCAQQDRLGHQQSRRCPPRRRCRFRSRIRPSM